jgi:AhpD family alkylhydroperoxidase
MGELLDQFNSYRQKMNERLMAADNNKVIKRIYGVDTLAYQDGSLDSKTKEMLGLVASMVLRCDDCIKYHLVKCHELGVTSEEMMEIFGIANLVGGTIVIPHTRRAMEFWDELQGRSSG